MDLILISLYSLIINYGGYVGRYDGCFSGMVQCGGGFYTIS